MSELLWPASTPAFGPGSNLLDARSRSAKPSRITDEVRREVRDLSRAGIRVEIVEGDLTGHLRLDPDRQQLVDRAIDEYSRHAGFADALVEANPAVGGWLAMAKAKSPLALAIFYNTGAMDRPSDGMSEREILDDPLQLVGSPSARELLHELNPGRAQSTLDRVARFFAAGSLRDGVDAFGLTAHEIMTGSLDRIGDITRANSAIAMIRDKIGPASGPLVTASLACGAAEPVFWLVDRLRAQGTSVATVHLVDIDPVALSASLHRSRDYDLADRVILHRRDLLATPMSRYIEPYSVDVVDVIGLFEYLPRAIRDTPIASQLLRNAAEIVRPGGTLVFGNMLRARPQQRWFEGLWPRLHQRTISEVLAIVEEAGFARDQVRVQVPTDGVYAMYTLSPHGLARQPDPR